MHHVVLCIYNTRPGLQDSALWVHRYIDNLTNTKSYMCKNPGRRYFVENFDNINTANR